MSEDVGGASFLSGSVWYSDPTLRATSQRARPVGRGAFTLGVERDEVRECRNAEPAAFRSASSPPSCGRVTQSESSCLSYPLGTWGRRSGTLSLLPEGQVPRRPSSDGASSRKPAEVATHLL